MSELVSREKIKQAIREYFKEQIDLISEDKGVEYVIDRVDIILEHNKGLIDAIKKIPVEFDVDKVMDELKEQSYELDFNGEYENSNVIDSEIAIEIVKKGGIE